MMLKGLLLYLGTIWARKRLRKYHVCARTCLNWTPVLRLWILASISSRISLNTGYVSTSMTRLCDDPDIYNIVTCPTGKFQRSVEHQY